MSSSDNVTTGIRDLGYSPGILPTGKSNSILDVPGVHISQVTVPTSDNLKEGSTACKGVTVILPRGPKDFHVPCHAGTFTFNGNGELTGSRQIADWGFTNTPIAFTNSLSLGTVFNGCWDWVQDRQDELGMDDLMKARTYGTPVVGETADWWVNSETRRSRLSKEDIAQAFSNFKSLEDGAVVEQGQRGGGAGMTCHQFTGGTGTSSRIVKGDARSAKEYVLGALCQSNYGHLVDLTIGGIPIGKILKKEREAASNTSQGHESTDVHAPPTNPTTTVRNLAGRTKDGSILILLITNAPLLPHQLQRLARHATAGLACVGSHGIGRTHSGDIFLALSTAGHPSEQLTPDVKMGHINPTQTYEVEVVKNESIDPYFVACAEATEEAVLNSLVGGREGTVGMDGTRIDGLPVNRVKALLEQYLVKV